MPHHLGFVFWEGFEPKPERAIFLLQPRDPRHKSPTMNGEDPQERPEQIRNIIGGLERYNPQAAEVLEAYLQQQCEEKFCDCNANRALLKL